MKKKKTKKKKEQRGSTSASRPLYREVPKHRENCRKSHITSAGSGSKQKNKTAAVFCPESSCWPLVETQRDLLFSLLNFVFFFFPSSWTFQFPPLDSSSASLTTVLPRGAASSS